ncbi:MAG: TolC family protein [Rhizobacter sp.]|nr:TolC family protein [Chlorobiales bacterium]
MMTQRLQVILKVVGLIALAHFLFAPTQTLAQSFSPAQSDSLSLAEFQQRVLAAHPALRAAALETDIADAELQNAFGGFDPLFKGKYELKHKDDKDKFSTFDVGLELPISTFFGPRVSAGFKRAVGTDINPENRTAENGEASLGITLPLIQGFATDRRRAALSKAQLRPDLSAANQVQERNNLLRAASLKYWDWAESYSQLRIAENLLTIASDRSRAIAVRSRRGENAAIDSVEALLEVERRRGERYRAVRTAEQNTIDLSIFVWNQDGSPQPVAALPQALPVTTLLTRVDEAQVQIDKAAAMMLRPEVRRVDVAQRSAQIDLGLAQELQRPLIEAQVQSLFSKFNNLTFSDYKASLTISQPLLFRSASATAQLAQISLQRTDFQRVQVERSVMADIDNAVSAMERAMERTQAAEREASLADVMQRAERRRFEAGESTLLFVNLRERAAAEALIRLATARADYLRAITQYRWATGRI